MTSPQEDAELRGELQAVLDEFVLFTDHTPHSSEPTELSVFLRQCDFPKALNDLGDELMQLIKARDEQREREILIDIASDRKYRAEDMPHLISRNAIVRRLKALTNPQEQDKEEE